MAVQRGIDRASGEFAAAVAQLTAAEFRPELVVREMPAPSRIAPHAFALGGDIVVRDEDLGTGRFILLHDRDGHDAWQGTYRCVTFARATVEREMAVDESLPSVGWSWLLDALQTKQAGYGALSGSVTVVRTESFGEMSGDRDDAQIELRASWTPDGDFDAHIRAWAETLCMIAGLPPLEEGVVALRRRRGVTP